MKATQPFSPNKGDNEEEAVKHIILSDAWLFGKDPFPAYRCELIFGRNKKDRQFLPVINVMPVTTYTVTAEGGRVIPYEGTDRTEAERIAEMYSKGREGNYSWNRAEIKEGYPVLPDDRFRVIKSQEKGTILVVPGNDATKRCLLFAGRSGGFRGGVTVLGEATTGKILKECSAGNACESRTEVIALLEPGQSVGFWTHGRRTNEVYLHTWNSAQVETRHFSKAEWDTRNLEKEAENAEVL